MDEAMGKSLFETAIEFSLRSDIGEAEKVEVLLQIADQLILRPQTPEPLRQAFALYEKAQALVPVSDILLIAKIRQQKAMVLQMIPGDIANLENALMELEEAISVFEQAGESEALAEANMAAGLIIQSLAGLSRPDQSLAGAIRHYHKALAFFKKGTHPREYAVIHNNLATAYLSIPMIDEKAKMKEALAVQSFQAALEVVTIENDPVEFAMLQNNLGNALQYASSSHIVENNLRALEAYEQALKVRNERSCPLAFANTIANKANCLRNLPDDLEKPEAGNVQNVSMAVELYKKAKDIFFEGGEEEKVLMLAEALEETEKILAAIVE